MYWPYGRVWGQNGGHDMVPFPQETHSLMEHRDKTHTLGFYKRRQHE